MVLHNPISVLYYVWDYLFPEVVKRDVYNGELSSDCKFVKICDENEMDALWSMGFFGKGILSRSEPTWFPRTARRLKLKGGDKITAEDITEARRKERKKFKKQRAKTEQEELNRRRAMDDPSFVVNELVDNSTDEEKEYVWRNEDYEIVENNEELRQIEYLQLSPCEALFLQYALGVLKINSLSTTQLLETFIKSSPNFLNQYIAYHHYRSKGWCCRSGIKFGTDWLLYRRGPPFAHADFAVLVMDPNEQESWWWFTNVSRVVGGVQKTLVLCYVDQGHGENLEDILQTSKVRELVYRRWRPARSRD